MPERASTCESEGSRLPATSATLSPSVTESMSCASATNPAIACTTPNAEYEGLESTMKTATNWDASKYLETEEDMAAYLNAALEDGDASVIAAALGDIARTKGMTQLSKETGITRDGLYKALSPTGNPSFDTVQKVVRAFGLKLDVAAN